MFIACSSRSEAKARARQEQTRDTSDAYWVHLKLSSGRWVARRMKRKSRWEFAADLFFGNLISSGPAIETDFTPYLDPDESEAAK